MVWQRMRKMRSIVDLSRDGQINIVDITLCVIALLFATFSLCLLVLGGMQCYYALYYHENLLTLITYVGMLTQIFGTFGTLIYSIAFFTSADSPNNSNCGFFDFDKDGQVGIVDVICTIVGTIHSLLILLNGWIWCLGIFVTPEVFKTSDVVDFVAANTRVVILILTKSYLASPRDPTKWTRWNYFIDVNHDGVLELVDIFAFIFNTSYCVAVIYSFTTLLMSPFGKSDLGGFIQLTSQINFVLISAFASVYLSKQIISNERRRILELVAFSFLILLGRTIIEISLSGDLFKSMSRLLNGLVLGITQLFIGVFIMRTQQAEARLKQS